MITFYTVDAQRIFIESIEVDPLGPLPSPCFTIAPPETTGTEVARWNGTWWEVLEERPVVVPQPVPIPQSVTMRQASLALFQAGYLARIQTSIDELPEPERSLANIEWNKSGVVERNQHLVLTLGQSLGLSDAELDDLFTLAATL